MDYRGVIIEESLTDTDILNAVRITGTEVEPVTEGHKTPWLKQWTLHTVEIPENEAAGVVQRLSKVISDSPSSWYADFKNDKYHYIIYPEKIFRIDRANPDYAEARNYGVSLGIPEYQVDFAPDNTVWER